MDGDARMDMDEFMDRYGKGAVACPDPGFGATCPFYHGKTGKCIRPNGPRMLCK